MLQNYFKMTIWILTSFLLLTTRYTSGAIVPPPWSNTTINPCAALPGGWQLLYWPPLKQCFKIFSLGYPCPETMELSPVGNSMIAVGMTAECRCPPGTAENIKTNRCYKLFEKGPCDVGQYFSPVLDLPGKSAIPKKRIGVCKVPNPCLNGMILWPKDEKCYSLYTRGPCPKGTLLTIGKDKIAECNCENRGDLAQYFYDEDNTCHEHYTRGPCLSKGELFLPNKRCGCNKKLPHYHESTGHCFELGTIGPCKMGQQFILSDNTIEQETSYASCHCKDGYVMWSNGFCYRTYTRGPCQDGQFLLNTSECIDNPCGKGRLYFPDEKTCYRIGSQGPCSLEQVVVFDFTTRPSVDGISYNGVCGCIGIISNLDQSCVVDDKRESACNSSPGMVELNNQCYKLYSRGPCGPGQWLEPRKIPNRADKRSANCHCKPGYTQYETQDGIIGCHAPSVSIARYLNGKNYKNYTFGFN